jgi:maltooligosyltrehalose trehalohydrolase
MRRRHAMPFGAQMEEAGTRFRLWAPMAKKVELDLTHARGRANLPMFRAGGGWYEVNVDNLEAGACYLFRIDEALSVPDPASRSNPKDVHSGSELVDPLAFEWPDAGWKGRPWEESVIYELHVGTFTPEGTFNAAIARLDYLVRLGITAVELMPVADFPGKRNWGYDGVLPYAPDASYGSPADLKSLVAAAHARGLSMILDVVYNHFGPEGNYLHAYAPQFFNEAHQTPWGAAINFDGPHARTVRDFFIHNALYWIEEFHFDGLRMDAVHAIADDSTPDIVTEIAAALRNGPGRERHVHLVLENDRNQSHYLERGEDGRARLANAQWNDDFHHPMHVIATGERDGYYADYADRPVWRLGRALAEGFGYQGEPSAHRGGDKRGEPSAQLTPVAFVNFLQSHDQVGNRALGERLNAIGDQGALKLGATCLLLAPAVPMIFMGEEFAAGSPFQFFCDFGPDLAAAVRQGRRREFASFARFSDLSQLEAIPDPGASVTFSASKLEWDEVAQAGHAEWHTLYSDLMQVRRLHVAPHLGGRARGGTFALVGEAGLAVDWTLADGARLHLRANFSAQSSMRIDPAPGECIFATGGDGTASGMMPPWGATWMLEAPDA